MNGGLLTVVINYKQEKDPANGFYYKINDKPFAPLLLNNDNPYYLALVTVNDGFVLITDLKYDLWMRELVYIKFDF